MILRIVKMLNPEIVFDVKHLPMTRDSLAEAQKADLSLSKYFNDIQNSDSTNNKDTMYFIENGLLLRRWRDRRDGDSSAVVQVVIPSKQSVLSLAHDNVWAGHLGVAKTYDRVLQHFFWPGLKKDVTNFCRTCPICQVVGKPNQVIQPAPLRPIPAVGEAFEHVLVDCVGPLPKTKNGNQYLLTMMCLAIPLRKITVVKALIKFFSTFGLPKIVQTDQGTNFLSGIFEQVLKSLAITHRVSSAYHPESQGALERWHGTLKSVRRKYCLEHGKDWDDGVPLALFAVREAVQESLGFSPAELVFGHTVRGPLKVLKDSIIGDGLSKR